MEYVLHEGPDSKERPDHKREIKSLNLLELMSKAIAEEGTKEEENGKQ